MSDTPTQDTEMPLMSHLIELRTRLVRAVGVILLLFVSLFYFSGDLYTFVAKPLMERLPEGTQMQATGAIAPFFTNVKLTLAVSFFIAMPYVLFQLWGFISPALYKKEKAFAVPLVVSSIALFYAGMSFAYYLVFPLLFDFLPNYVPDNIDYRPDMADTLNVMLKLFFAFGLAFEIPIATILLIWSGFTTAEDLRKKRPYIIVGVFVIAMLLTPPDVISQTLLAVPMMILFELGIYFSYAIKVRAEKTAEPATEDEV